MAKEPTTQATQTSPAPEVVAQPEALSLDDACQRLSETVASPEALAGFYVCSEALPHADLATWRARFDSWLKQPA